MKVTIGDIISILDVLAPPSLAETWDNIGLQVGSLRWPVRRIWVALDPTFAVVSAAAAADVDLVITHHPLWLKPTARIDFDHPQGRVIELAARTQTAIFAAHTNLDSTAGGLNDQLCHLLDVQDPRPLAKQPDAGQSKLVFQVTRDFEKQILDSLLMALSEAGGPTPRCSLRHLGAAPHAATSPQQTLCMGGESGAQLDTIRIETTVPTAQIGSLTTLLSQEHADALLSVDVYPLAGRAESPNGLGRIGRLAAPQTLEGFAVEVKNRLGLASVRVVGDRDLSIEQVAVCTGSGAGLLGDFFRSQAQVYVSGDFKYHEALDIQARDRGLIDAGHFATEHIMVAELQRCLRAAVAQRGWSVDVSVCSLEKDPFFSV